MKLGALRNWALFAAFLLPAWAVKAAPMQSRMLWVGIILFFAFFGAMKTAIKAIGPPQVEPAPAPTNPMLGQRRVQQAWICGLTFLLAELSAIAFTYAEPGVGTIGSYGVLVSSLGTNLFPVIAKYATAMQPPLSPASLFRVQSIVSIFLLAAVPFFVAFMRVFLAMSDSDWRQHFESNHQRRPSDFFVVVGIPFCLLIAGTALFGGFEFSELSKFDQMTAPRCLLMATCYARGDDLLMFAAAFIKAFVAFGAPLGVIVLVAANRLLP